MRSGGIWLPLSAQLLLCFLYLLSVAATSEAPVASEETIPPVLSLGPGFPTPACCMGAAEPRMMGTAVGTGTLLCPPQTRRLLEWNPGC